MFLGKKRVLGKIYYNINKERKLVIEIAFVCREETSFIKALPRFFVRLPHIIIVNPSSFRIK
ncbi:hypothetical protein C7Y46_13820 [Bacillus safensis]|nr:hypothetical protein C7Y46_13820 [Bacillus sp. SDF0016]